MSGLKFLIMLFVIYLIFRFIMRKVLSAVNSEGGGALKSKLGNVIERMKLEMEKARLEAEREASGADEEISMVDDPWGVLKRDNGASPGGGRSLEEELLEEDGAAPVRSRERWNAEEETPSLRERWDAEDETPSLHERWDAEEETPSLHERWDAVDEAPSRWDSPEGEELPRAARVRVSASGVLPETCHVRRRRRMRLKEAVIWKEILDQPVGMRS